VSDKLNPEIWKGMSPEAQAAYAERNALAWRIVRSVLPGAGGGVDDYEPKVTDTIERLRAELGGMTKARDVEHKRAQRYFDELEHRASTAETATLRKEIEHLRADLDREHTMHLDAMKLITDYGADLAALRAAHERLREACVTVRVTDSSGPYKRCVLCGEWAYPDQYITHAPTCPLAPGAGTGDADAK